MHFIVGGQLSENGSVTLKCWLVHNVVKWFLVSNSWAIFETRQYQLLFMYFEPLLSYNIYVKWCPPSLNQGRHGWQGLARPRRPGPCLDFGFQYVLIRNNQSKKCGVEYWALHGSNSPWRPWIYKHFVGSLLTAFKYVH